MLFLNSSLSQLLPGEDCPHEEWLAPGRLICFLKVLLSGPRSDPQFPLRLSLAQALPPGSAWLPPLRLTQKGSLNAWVSAHTRAEG